MKGQHIWVAFLAAGTLSLLTSQGPSADAPETPRDTVTWETDLPAEIFPFGVPRSRQEVNLEALLGARRYLTGERPMERPPIYIQPPREGSVEYATRCNLLVNAVSDWSLVLYPDRPLPEDPWDLLSSPVLLWRLKHLEPAGPPVRESLISEVNGGRTVSPAARRLEQEGAVRLKPGQYLVVQDLSYPQMGPGGSPAVVICHPGANENLAFSRAIWLRTKEDFAQTLWAQVRVSGYWGAIVRNVRQGAAIYYAETGGKMPQSRADFASVLGPENPKAWNPAVEELVERLIPKLTPAMFRIWEPGQPVPGIHH